MESVLRMFTFQGMGYFPFLISYVWGRALNAIGMPGNANANAKFFWGSKGIHFSHTCDVATVGSNSLNLTP